MENNYIIRLTEEQRKDFLKKKISVISSGGLHLITMLGFYSCLQENNLIPNFRYYFGSSAGSIVSLILISKLNIKKFFNQSYNDIDQMLSLNVKLKSIYSLIAKGYLFEKFEGKTKIIESILNLGFGDINLTFRDLHRLTDKHLVVVLSDFFNGDVVYASHITSPHLSVLSAIDGSSNLPYLFRPLKLKIPFSFSDYYIDGASSSFFPLPSIVPNCSRDNYFEKIEDQNGKSIGPDDIFGFRISTREIFIFDERKNNKKYPPKKDINLASLIFSSSFVIFSSQGTLLREEWMKNIIEIANIEDISLFQRNQTINYREIFKKGMTVCVFSIEKLYNETRSKK